MSFFKQESAVDKDFGGISEDNIATPQEAIALPWFCGWARLKASWITDSAKEYIRASDVTNVRLEGGQKAVYAAMKGAFSTGPVDSVRGFYVGDRWYTLAATRSTGRYADFDGATINDGRFVSDKNSVDGDIRLHWGTDDAVKADQLEVNYHKKSQSETTLWGTGVDHPPYRRVCYVEFSTLFHGVNGRNPVNIEAELGRSPVLPAAFSAINTTLYANGVNPVAALLEVLTDPVQGRGWDASRFNVSTWEAVATAFFGGNYAISPVVTSAGDWTDTIDELLSYFDGYLYTDNDGLICLGYIPAGGTPTAVCEISAGELLEEPDLSTEAPDKAPTELTVVYTDASNYKESAVSLANPVARLARGQDSRETLQRPWMLSETQATRYLNQYLGQLWGSRLTGTLRVRADKAVDGSGNRLKPGDVINLDYTPAALDQLMRVQKVKTPFARPWVELDVESERGAFPTPYVPSLTARPTKPTVTLGTLTNVRVLVGPLDTAGRVEAIPLVGRADAQTAGAFLWLSDDDVSYGQEAVAELGLENFALAATLDADLTAGATSATVTPADEDLEILESMTTQEQANDTLLLIVGDEIMSIGTVTPGVGDEYTVTISRGRQGTTAAAHDTSAGASPIDCHIIRRSNLLRVTHDLTAIGTSAATIYAKVQAVGLNAIQTLSGVTAVTFTVPSGEITADWSGAEFDAATNILSMDLTPPTGLPGAVLIVEVSYAPIGGSVGDYLEMFTLPLDASVVEYEIKRPGLYWIRVRVASGTWRGDVSSPAYYSYSVSVPTGVAVTGGAPHTLAWTIPSSGPIAFFETKRQNTTDPSPQVGEGTFLAGDVTSRQWTTGITNDWYRYYIRSIDRYGNPSAWVTDDQQWVPPS